MHNGEFQIMGVTYPFKNETQEREKEWGEQNYSDLAIAY
jgi:hypothetical protein